ncbi:MAG: sugar phosphate nucleotidyltransferase [Oligoflexia bacterium]|nr:sugar phosphate nucleotidyltransferase [Oligoflexia bacterium]
MSIQAVILAGGLGTRLGALTKDTPKPLMKIRGKPFLHWQIDYLKNEGVTDFLFLTGFKGELIHEYFGDGSQFGVYIQYSQEVTPLGTGGALIQAYQKLNESFLLLFGDSFLPVNVSQVFSGLEAPMTDVVMTVYDNRENTSVPFNVGLEGLRVKRYEKVAIGAQISPDLTHVEAGVYGVKKTLFKGHALKVCSFESELLKSAIQLGSVAAIKCSQRFFDIGTPERLALFEERIGDYFTNTL